MGLFNFFKRNENNKTREPAVELTRQGGFNLNLNDFKAVTHKAEVIDVKMAADFEKEFAHLITGKPAKSGDVIELKKLNVRVKLWGQPVDVTFEPDKISKSLESFVEKINEQLNWANESQNLFDQTLIRDLLKLENSSRLEENQPSVTEVNFLNSIRLTSINFLPDAAFEIQYSDGDIFGGHSILVDVSAKREIKKATIAG